MEEIRENFVQTNHKSFFKKIVSLFVLGFGMYLVYAYFYFMNTTSFTYYYNPYQQTELSPTNLLLLSILFLISLVLLKFLPIKKWWDGIQEIGMFLFILPAGIGFFLSYLIELYKGVYISSISIGFIWATFIVPFLLSYIKIITIFKARKK